MRLQNFNFEVEQFKGKDSEKKASTAPLPIGDFCSSDSLYSYMRTWWRSSMLKLSIVKEKNDYQLSVMISYYFYAQRKIWFIENDPKKRTGEIQLLTPESSSCTKENVNLVSNERLIRGRIDSKTETRHKTDIYLFIYYKQELRFLIRSIDLNEPFLFFVIWNIARNVSRFNCFNLLFSTQSMNQILGCKDLHGFLGIMRHLVFWLLHPACTLDRLRL